MSGQPTIEQRISQCEAEIAELRGEWQGISDLVEARLRLSDTRVARLQSEINEVRRDLGELKHGVTQLKQGVTQLKVEIAELRDGFDTLPRVIVEMLDERRQRDS